MTKAKASKDDLKDTKVLTEDNKPFVEPRIAQYAEQHTQAGPELLQELIDDTFEHINWPDKLSGRVTGRFLKLITQISGAKKALELGMFTGYSALSIAEALPDDGKVITCDTNPRAIEFAKTFFERSPHGHKIEAHHMRALDLIEQVDNDFDLIFIDADKRNYLNYYQLAVEKTKSGGLIIVDNALWYGHVLKPRDEKDQMVADTNTLIANDDRVENVLLTAHDGINLVRKK